MTTAIQKTAKKEPIHRHEQYRVYDTDRYLTDEYTISVSLQESEDTTLRLGVYMTLGKIGLSSHPEYWLFESHDKKLALKTHEIICEIIKELCETFNYRNWPMSILMPKVQDALKDIALPNKEASTVPHFNWASLMMDKESDWRTSLYGQRYPGFEVSKLEDNWINSLESSKKVSVSGSKRNAEFHYQYEKVAEMDKLAQWNTMVDMILNKFPMLSTAAIISFLTMFPKQALNPNKLKHMLETNPQAVREAIPEMPPDYDYQNQQSPPEQEIEEEPKSESAFSGILGTTLQFEGGYVNHPQDPGGETNKGITKAVYTQWLTKQGMPTDKINMREIPQEHVQAIYKEMYWDKIGGDNLPQVVAQQLFDYAVHSGVKKAVTTLQVIIGANDDGIFGPNTLSAAQTYIQQHSENELAKKILGSRRVFLESLGKQEKFKAFAKGWMNRIIALEKTIPNSNGKPMRIRDKNPPESQIATFSTPQADFWGGGKKVNGIM